MARYARPNSRTSLRYISPDDSAIGFEPGSQEFKDAWSKYAETFDESVLNLKPGEAPSYYYLRILSFDSQTKFYDALRASDAEGDETTSTVERMFSPEMIATTRDFIEHNLIGCDDHQEVTNIDATGNFEIKRFGWKPGDVRPDGLVESVVADQILSFNMIMFCINTNRLSEKEKKR